MRVGRQLCLELKKEGKAIIIIFIREVKIGSEKQLLDFSD